MFEYTSMAYIEMNKYAKLLQIDPLTMAATAMMMLMMMVRLAGGSPK